MWLWPVAVAVVVAKAMALAIHKSSLWQKRLMDTPQSSKSQAWQEVASIHSSAILQALLAPSE